MSYTKLFGSILDSTIWQAPTDTRIVWITMLAMKDQDGLVEASVPGLAKRAGVSLEAAEEALGLLLAPDPYSRTTEHEGRRIEKVDGGWVVLNHHRYRDREDAAERRQKDAKRAAKYRERRRDASRDVTPNHAGSHDVTTSDTDTDPDREPLSPDQALSPLELPDPGATVRAERAPPPGIPAPGGRDPRIKLNHDAWQYAALEHARLRGEGLSPDAIPWPVMPAGAAMTDLVDRTREVLAMTDPPDLEAARAVLKRRVDVAVAESKREQHLNWLTPMRVWNRESFWRAVEVTPAQAAKPRAGPRGSPSSPPTDEPRRIKTLT